MMDPIKHQTEQDKALLLCSVIEAAELHLVINELGEDLQHGVSGYGMTMSVCDGLWHIRLSRNGVECVEGGGHTLAEAIKSTLPYLDALDDTSGTAAFTDDILRERMFVADAFHDALKTADRRDTALRRTIYRHDMDVVEKVSTRLAEVALESFDVEYTKDFNAGWNAAIEWTMGMANGENPWEKS